MIKVLVVDDDFHVAKIHAAYVARLDGFSVVGQAHSAAETHAAVAEQHPDLVLLDLYLPDGNGLDVLRRITAAHSGAPGFIVITAARDVDSVRTAMQLGSLHYLVKPFGFPDLRERLTAYQEWRTHLTEISETDQADIDELYGMLRRPAAMPSSLPKGHSAPTLERVRDAVRSSGDAVSAAEVARLIGISRPTAQRYLTYLERHGVLVLTLRYGTTGRPEHRYRPAR